MTRSGRKAGILLLFLIASLAGKAQDLFDYSNSNKFAQYLLSTRQYGLAAHEYERILSLRPGDTLVFTNLLKTFRLNNDCSDSFERLKAYSMPGFLKNRDFAKEYLNLSLSCSKNFGSNDFQAALQSVDQGSRIFYTVGSYITGGFKDSAIIFANRNRDFLAQTYPSVLTGIDKMNTFKPKSPGLALAMSTILPGSGKAYSKYWGDAVMSFLFVSTNAWLSYRGFSKKGIESAHGWIFGSLSVGFYVGNLFGSYKAAKNYNQIEYDKIYNEAKAAVYSGY